MLEAKIFEEIARHQKILFLTHKSPDGDAVGSVFAFSSAVKKYFSTQIKILFEEYDTRFDLIKFIKSDVFDLDQATLVIVLDCGDKKRLGALESALANKFVINIDHHVSNTNFGNINFVDPNLSSTCEIIYGLIKKLGVLDKEIAACLYTGIICDTGGFRFKSTTPNTHMIIAELITYGFDFTRIYSELVISWSHDDVNILRRALKNLEIDKSVALAYLTHEQVFDIASKSSSKLISFLKSIVGVEIAITIIETEKNFCKISFRADDFDVCAIAKQFGGGGHKLAAGCAIKTHALDARAQILKAFDLIRG